MAEVIEKLKKRQETIGTEHNQIFDRMNELQSELNQLSSRRLQLEGAFNELAKIIEEMESEDKIDESKASDKAKAAPATKK